VRKVCQPGEERGKGQAAHLGWATACATCDVTKGASAHVTPSTVSTRMCSSAKSTISAMPACSAANGEAARTTCGRPRRLELRGCVLASELPSPSTPHAEQRRLELMR
jgi:hypothetical protein